MQDRDTTNPKSRSRGGKRRKLRWLILLAGLGVAGSLAAAATVIGAYFYVSPSLPQAETIREIPCRFLSGSLAVTGVS